MDLIRDFKDPEGIQRAGLLVLKRGTEKGTSGLQIGQMKRRVRGLHAPRAYLRLLIWRMR